MHPVVMSREPDDVHFETDLYDAGWELKPIDAWGEQATFDFFNSGNVNRGLRLTLPRALAVGSVGNDLPVAIGFGAALDLDWDAADGLHGTLTASTTLAQLRGEIIGLAEFAAADVAYYNGELGPGGTPDLGYQGGFGGGTPDLPAWVEFTVSSANLALVDFATSAPANNNNAFVVPRTGLGRFMRAGQRIYTNRGTSNDVPGSIELWALTPDEQRFYGLRV